MRTTDFSRAPALARAGAMLTVQPRRGRVSRHWLRAADSASRREVTPVRREWLRSPLLRSGLVVWYADRAAAERALADVVGEVGECRSSILVANPHGYSNGVWRAEDGTFAHIADFTPLSGETNGPPVIRGSRSATPTADDAGSGATTLRVVPVTTRRELAEFCTPPLWGRRQLTHGVPLWHSAIRRWWSGQGPQVKHGEVELFLVRDEQGDVRGRTTLHTDARMDEKVGAPTLLLGATDFADRAALEAIVAHADSVARARGRNQLLGPVSLLPNQVGGVVTSHWDRPGFLDGPWNPERHPGDWEALGVERIWTGATWCCPDLQGLDVDAVFPERPDDDTATSNTVVRQADRRRLDEQLPILRTMLNASFAQLPYYTHIEADELEAATDGLTHLLDESLLFWLEEDATPVAFVLTVPDYTDFARSTRGRASPLDAVRLLLTRGRYRRDAVLIIKGTVPEAQGRGHMRRLSRELLRRLQAGGYQRLRVTFIEDGNVASATHFADMGGQPWHDTTFYRRDVLDSGPAVDADSPAAQVLDRSADWGRAPSAHNTQPWDVRAADENTLVVGWHRDRELSVADPTRRDLMLGLGAVTLAITTVAADLGLDACVDWETDPTPERTAVIRLRRRADDASRSWTVADLHARATSRAPYVEQPGADEVSELGRHALAGVQQLGHAGVSLHVLPDELVTGLLPRATAHSLTGPGADELARWLRLDPSHPRYTQDGLSDLALGLSRLEARGLGWLTTTPAVREMLRRSRLDGLLARAARVSPRGVTVALCASPDLTLGEVGELGSGLLATWLAGQRAGWSAHPSSELIDEPTTRAAVDAEVSRVARAPRTAYAIWRWGRPEGEIPRSPRLTDTP